MEGISRTSIVPVLRSYQQATEFDPQWYKAWHAWAYMNFQTIKKYKDKVTADTQLETLVRQDFQDDETMDHTKLIVSAVQGFFR